jgi:tetratricopeptide (TPR) repeat protein
MKNTFLLLLIILGLTFGIAANSLSENAFSNGIENYQNKKYKQALKDFKKIEKTGLNDDKIYYNIGNCYFRLGKLGHAIQYYKIALKVNPNNEKVRKDLEYVLTMTKDKQNLEEISLTEKTLLKIYNFFSPNFSAILSLLFFGGIILIVNIIIMKFRGREKTIPIFIFIILLILFIIFSSFSYLKWKNYHNVNEGVLLSSVEPGFSGPSEDFTRVFTIHEGMIFKIVKSDGDWTQIQLNNGLGGWIKRVAIGKIRLTE